MEIKIIHKNENFLIIDKPAGWVVHEGAGEHQQIVAEWLIKKYPEMINCPWLDKARPGVVHRLDKDTSGLMILAKNPATQLKLQELFQSKKIKKTYAALVFGKIDKEEGEISGFIGRDPSARRQQLAKSIHFDFEPGKVREAKTHYRVIKLYRYQNYDLTLVRVTLDTGRMHQIRVHFKSIGHPVIGDPIYNIKHSRKLSKSLGISRQFLHAQNLEFINPFDNKKISLTAPLPEDLKNIIFKLEQFYI